MGQLRWFDGLRNTNRRALDIAHCKVTSSEMKKRICALNCWKSSARPLQWLMQNRRENFILGCIRKVWETVLHLDSDVRPDLEYDWEPKAERTGLEKWLKKMYRIWFV